MTAGCSGDPETRREPTTQPKTSREADATQARPTEPPPPKTARGYTSGGATGNRAVEGEGRLPEVRPIDVPLSGTPLWVVGTPLEEDIGWTVAYGDGRVDSFRLDSRTNRVGEWLTAPTELPPGAPPAVVSEGERMRLPTGGSPLTHPVETESGTLSITQDGTLSVSEGEAPPLTALPDARLIESAEGSVAFLTEPTRRYDHGVLGDDLEADSLTVLRPTESGYETRARIEPESGGVFEAQAPLWFGPPGDELLAVTESVAGAGARLSVYEPDGALVAAGPFVGTPQTWRHLIAAGPFGPNGASEIAVTRTPHAEAATEFYRLGRKPGELQVVATGPGYPSHTLYSRNLDAARAGDFDGDGAWELLVPDDSYTGFVALRRVRGGVEEAWRLPLGGNLSTNIGSAVGEDGRVAVAAGTTDGVLRIWR